MPTALLPRFRVTWTATDLHRITASYRLDDTDIGLHHTLDDEARVRSVVFDRWGDPDATGTWGHHPFGFEATGYSTFDGVTIPYVGRAGWFYGTDRWNEGESGPRSPTTTSSRGEPMTPGSSPKPCGQGDFVPPG